MSAIEILRQLALGTSRLGRYSRIEPQAADGSFFNSDLSGAAIARYPLAVVIALIAGGLYWRSRSANSATSATKPALRSRSERPR